MSTARMSRLLRTRARYTALLVISMAIVSGCASSGGSTPAKRTPVKIEVQEAVGFTITEEARINNDARLSYNQGVNALDRGGLDEGIELLEAAVNAAPQLSAPRIDLGIAYHRAGNLEAAEENLLLALEVNPNHPIANNELGIIYRKTGRFAEAKRSYETALTVYPGYHYARRNLAVLCDLYLGDLNCAKQNYEAYMATVPSDEQASMWIKDLHYRMQQAE